ncbi:MAG: hypothetical protein ACLTAY_06485 [Thomasclavelia ramosa]
MNLKQNIMTVQKNICPECGQMRTQEQIKKFEEEFNIYKSNRLEELNAKGLSLLKEYKERSVEIDDLENKVQEYQNMIDESKVKLSELTKKNRKYQRRLCKRTRTKNQCN